MVVRGARDAASLQLETHDKAVASGLSIPDRSGKSETEAYNVAGDVESRIWRIQAGKTTCTLRNRPPTHSRATDCHCRLQKSLARRTCYGGGSAPGLGDRAKSPQRAKARSPQATF